MVTTSIFLIFRRFLHDRLETYETFCDELLGEIDISLESLTNMENQYYLVSTKTGQLYQACEELLQQQV